MNFGVYDEGLIVFLSDIVDLWRHDDALNKLIRLLFLSLPLHDTWSSQTYIWINIQVQSLGLILMVEHIRDVELLLVCLG
jgi:hypothetical protein